MRTVLSAIATANPELRGSQTEAAAFMERITAIPERIRKRLPQIYARSGIEYRYSCVDDYGKRDAGAFTFFPQNWEIEPAPTTSERNRKYREAAVPLAESAAAQALAKADVEAGEVTHVIAVSCTGFFAPGLDIELVKRLGLAPDTQRTIIGFMGCYAAFNALRVAHTFCQAHPDAVVLVVCVELCTLHFQVDGSLESAIVNAIFSDGAAAAVLRSVPDAKAEGELTYVAGRALLDESSMGDMTWDIGDRGFLMGLSTRVPEVIAARLPEYLDGLLSSRDLTRDEVGFWAIHPGGRAIVDRAQEVLDLPDAALRDSLEVLRLYGNMSSPTILFVLKRILEQTPRPKNGIALAFGPGLTIEGALFEQA